MRTLALLATVVTLTSCNNTGLTGSSGSSPSTLRTASAPSGGATSPLPAPASSNLTAAVTSPSAGTGNSSGSLTTASGPTAGSGLGNPSGGPIFVNAAPGSVFNPQEGAAIKNCQKTWGSLWPFSPDRTIPDKIIFGNIEIGPANRIVDALLGTDFSGIDDEQVTATPELVLVISSINIGATDFILPEVTYKFMNPNGWYCLAFSLDIASAVEIELKKGAQLADSQFSFSLLSSSSPIAANQISILSDLNVVSVP